MLEELQQHLIDACGLDKEEKILVGVSGGPDSLCLLDALDVLGYHPVAAHLNHQLRPEAGQEALAIEHFCQERGLPYISGSLDVPALAREQRQSIEEAAREARYQFLFEQAARNNAQAVAVGHTADDQVETVLMHLLRGAGLAGLSGMPVRALPNAWSSAIPLVRPLLSFWRRQIEAYCESRGLKPSIDLSNLDQTYYRNRLRHELIPHLEGYNPAVREILWRMAKSLRGDLEIISQMETEAWEKCVRAVGAGYIALKRKDFLQLNLGLQRRLIRRAVACLRPGLRDIDFWSVERGLRYVRDPGASLVDFTAGLHLRVEGDLIWLAKWGAALPAGNWPVLPEERLDLTIPAEIRLPGGWALTIREVTDPPAARAAAHANQDPFQAWVRLDDLPGPISLRTRRPGDRFEPLGMEGRSVKLADFFVNRKVPRRARDSWPLLCAGEEILWIPGLQLAHPFRVEESTRRIAHLRLTRDEITAEGE